MGKKKAKLLLSVEINFNKACCTTISKSLTIDIKFCEVLCVNSELIIILIIIIIIIIIILIIILLLIIILII